MAQYPVDLLRSSASYRITFPDVGGDIPTVIGLKVADVLDAFRAAEVRVTAEGMTIFVNIPVDVTPEALDAKAEALRERWGHQWKAEDPRITALRKAHNEAR